MNALLLLLSCALQDPKSDVEKAIQKLRSQKSYRTKFTATIEAPSSDPLKIEGESVWVHPGVLYIQYQGTGGDEKRIIRVGDKVWIYHEFLEDWVTSQEMGSPGSGRGVQNPDEVLAVLANHADNAKVAGNGFTLEFAGGDIEKIMKEQASQGDFDWKKSRASANLTLANGSVSRFASAAELVSLDPKLDGKKIKYSAEVDIVSVNAETSIRFTVVDEKTKKPVDVAIPDYIRTAIEGYLVKKP